VKPHVHAELIHAWADGAEIECQNIATGTWSTVDIPAWGKGAIYRIKDPYAELKAAAADPTKEISADLGKNWMGAGFRWSWDIPPDCYQIRDKPKAKVKMWQWVFRGSDRGIYLTIEVDE
jgi:hypothetical protein